MLAMLEAYAREARISIDMFGSDTAGDSMTKLAFTVTHPYLNKMCHKYRAKLAARTDARLDRQRSMKKLTAHKARPHSAAPRLRPRPVTPSRLQRAPLTPRIAVRGHRMMSRSSHTS